MKTVLCRALLAFAVALPAATSAVPFKSIAFEEATALAGKEGKLVFIDFYTTWCQPCKMLDQETFSDARVGQVVGASAVALKLDAEKEGRLTALRYKVNAYPTLLVVKSDGTEVDRIVGFRPPPAFIADFNRIVALAKSGKSALQQARDEVAQQAKPVASSGEPEEAQPHFDLAKKLITAGKHEEALKELLWCWDEGKKDPEFSRMARSSQVPRELGRLARDYPPAREAMIARRNEARERALANKGGSVVVQDLIHLNRELKEDDDTVAVFDQMPEGDRRRVSISIYLFDVFVEKQRYKDATLFNLADSFTRNIDMARTKKSDEPSTAAFVRYTVTSTAKRVEALAGAGQIEQARDLATKLLALDSSDATKELVQKHVTRAGQPDLLKTP